MSHNSSEEFNKYLNILKSELSYADDEFFSWNNVVGLLIIKLTNTDSLNKDTKGSHATQIQLTSEREGSGSARKTEDFFPTLTLNNSFKSWRIAISARINNENIKELSGEDYDVTDKWRDDTIQIRRRFLNDDGQGNGNPALHICYGNDLMPLREQLKVGDYLVIVKCKDNTVYEAFGVRGTVDLGAGKNMYLSSRATGDMTSFSLEGMTNNQPTNNNNRITGGDNILLYGVPGSGKSWTIEHEYCKPGSIVERLVFHPDYTNGDFVGQILPVVDEEKQVTYEFTPGPFTRILRDAYINPDKEYVLIIEEINRGNAPAIFGEIFQLLDRCVEPKTEGGVTYPAGTSEYGITHASVAEYVYDDPGRKVRIPSNLSIVATMNTSDQNVFTLDTAFQRRWKMRLIDNYFDNVRDSLAEAKILDTDVTWKKFCESINSIIVGNKSRMVSAEDKRMGVYFIHEKDVAFDFTVTPSEGYPTILVEYNSLLKTERANQLGDSDRLRLFAIRNALMQNRIFPEKVIKYLWDDAFKFNPEALFDTERFDNLEDIIKEFVFSTGNDRLKVFKREVRTELLQDSQE